MKSKPILILAGMFWAAQAFAGASFNNFQKIVFYHAKSANEYILVVYATDPSTSRGTYDKDSAGIVLEDVNGRKIDIQNNDLKITNLGDLNYKGAEQYTLFRFSLVIDNSRSIDATSLNLVQQTLTRFFQRIPLAFEAQIIKFSHGIQLKTDFIKDKQQLIQYVNQPLPQGGTAFRDAVDIALTELQYSNENIPLRFCVALTDGNDTSSARNPDPNLFRDKVVQKCRDHSMPLFIGGITNSVDQAYLKSLTKFGYFYHVTSFPDVDRIFDSIEQMIKDAYVFRIPALSDFGKLKTAYIVKYKPNGQKDTVQDITIQ